MENKANTNSNTNENVTNDNDNDVDVSKLPTVIFSHGLGGNCDNYSQLCGDIASHGYIVIAMEHEDGSGSYAKSYHPDEHEQLNNLNVSR